MLGNIEVELTQEALDHALEKHEEVTVERIESAVTNPDLVILSQKNSYTILLYKLEGQQYEGEDLFFSVVVKKNSSGPASVVTAYETTKIKKGEVLYKKQK